MENINEKSFTDKMIDAVDKISGPFVKLANLPIMQSVQESIAAIISVIMLGSVALIVAAAADGGIGAAPLSFLLPWVDEIYVLYSVGMAFVGLYASVAAGIAYGNRLGIRDIDAAITSMACYVAINYNNFYEGFTVQRFGVGNMLGGLIAVLGCMKLFSWFLKKNITFKLPEVVPGNIGAVFTALIPSSICIILCWFIRTILGFDFITVMTDILAPLFKNTETVWFQGVYYGITGAFWTTGLHFMSMTSSIMSPITTSWLVENADAFSNGTPISELPHALAYGSWVGAFAYGWPLIFYMSISKVPGFKEIGRGIIPLYLFSISEPIWFGVPIVMNPYLMISNILAWSGGAVISYFMFTYNLCNRVFVQMPWATPHLISGFVETSGDWRFLLVIGANFAWGMLVHFPFFKAYERATLRDIEAKAALAEATAEA